MLSALTFSANFCFDSESHLSSYQGIKIITSFGPSSFLSMTWLTILLLCQSLFYFPDDLCLFFLLQDLRVCFSLCLECYSFLPSYLCVARSLTIRSQFKNQPFKCPSLPSHLKCHCAIHLLSCHRILFSLSTHPHLIVAGWFIHCFS